MAKKKAKRKRKKALPIELLMWQTDSGSNCPENCWCRRIVTVPGKGRRKRVFVSQGWITKEQAELIVRIHNEWLEQLQYKADNVRRTIDKHEFQRRALNRAEVNVS